MIRKNHQQGQIALIALLVLTVATTVGLSLIARSTTDVSVTRNIEESTRAFSAAEAGVEETLKSGIASSKTDINASLGVSYTTTIANVSGSVGNPFVFPEKTSKEDIATVWLVDHNPNGTVNDTVKIYISPWIDVCWSSETPNPAIVVGVLYKTSGGAYKVGKVVFDPDSRIPNVSSTTGSGCTANTAYTGRITFLADVGITPTSDTLIALRIRPVYNGARIAISPAQSLPSQGNNIQSVGTAGSNVNRKIVVYQQYLAPPPIFDYVIYSEGSFSH